MTKPKEKKITQNCPPYLSKKETQEDSKNKDRELSTMFNRNIIILTCCCTIIKMPGSKVDKFSAGRTKCRCLVKTNTWMNKPAQLLNQSSHALSLTLLTPGLVSLRFLFFLSSQLNLGGRIDYCSIMKIYYTSPKNCGREEGMLNYSSD